MHRAAILDFEVRVGEAPVTSGVVGVEIYNWELENSDAPLTYTQDRCVNEFWLLRCVRFQQPVLDSGLADREGQTKTRRSSLQQISLLLL